MISAEAFMDIIALKRAGHSYRYIARWVQGDALKIISFSLTNLSAAILFRQLIARLVQQLESPQAD